MSYGMFHGAGSFSQRLADARSLVEKSRSNCKRSEPEKWARRIKAYHRADKLYSRIWQQVHAGTLSPDRDSKFYKRKVRGGR